jgi:hypothetical protein
VVFVKDGGYPTQLEDFVAAKAATAVVIVGGGVLSDLACVCRTVGVPTVVLSVSDVRIEVVEGVSAVASPVIAKGAQNRLAVVGSGGKTDGRSRGSAVGMAQ